MNICRSVSLLLANTLWTSHVATRLFPFVGIGTAISKSICIGVKPTSFQRMAHEPWRVFFYSKPPNEPHYTKQGC